MTQKPATQQLTQYLITVGLLLLGFGVLVVGIDAMHMRPDEHLTFTNMQYGFRESMVELATRNNQAPLWWMMTWVWQRLVGMGEFPMRMHSVFLSMLTLSVVYQIGRQWFGKPRFGWFAVGLLSVNAYFFIYALEMRMYALSLLLTALSMRFFHAWLTKRTATSAIWYGLSMALLLYTHYYLGFVILAQAAYFVLQHLLDWRLVKQGVIAAVTAFVVWLPGVIILIGQLRFISFGGAGGLKIPTEPTNLQSLIELVQISSNGLFFIYVPLVLLGAFWLWQTRGYKITLMWLMLSSGLVLLINTQATIYTIRYTSYVAPAMAIAAGASLAALPSQRLRWGGFVVLVAVSLVGVPKQITDDCYPNVTTPTCNFAAIGLAHYIPNRIPYRNILTDVADHYQPGDVLIVQHDDGQSPFKQDQFERYLPDALLATQTDSIAAANNARRVWYVNNAWFNDNIRAAFDTLSATHRVRHVAGDCTRHWCYLAQLMVAPPRSNAIYFGDALGFLGADVTRSDTENTLSALLWWEVDETPSRDYSISLQLIAADGRLISQVDRQIHPPGTSDEIPTSQLQPDDNYIDQRQLSLPTESGTYALQLVVYQWWDGERLRLPDGTDTLPLQTITIE